VSRLNQAEEKPQSKLPFFLAKSLITLSALPPDHGNNLRKALELNQFEMYYQPKIIIATRQIVVPKRLFVGTPRIMVYQP